MNGSKIESGLQLFSRLSQRPNLQNLNQVLFEEGNPNPNDLIEITGASGTGKTLLVMDLLARCLLPKEYNGKGCGAIIINSDHHFNLFRFIEMMESLIKKCNIRKVSQSVVEDVIKAALNNLVILNCYDYQQFQITLLHLEKVLQDNENIGLLAIDGISTYYWEYRIINSTIISWQNYHSRILESLQNQVRNSNLVTVFTRNDVELTLDVNWKIVLKEYENKFRVLVIDIRRNTNKSLFYTIDKAINFLN